MILLVAIGDLEAARTKDRCALERVVIHSRQDLRRYAESHCVINDVEDAVQESLIAVSRKPGDLRGYPVVAPEPSLSAHYRQVMLPRDRGPDRRRDGAATPYHPRSGKVAPAPARVLAREHLDP